MNQGINPRNEKRNFAHLKRIAKTDIKPKGLQIASYIKRNNLRKGNFEKGKFYINKLDRSRTLKRDKTKEQREIVYIKDTETRAKLNEIAKIIEKGYNWQSHFGFLSGKSVLHFDNQVKWNETKGVYKIDLKNAFCQITESWIYNFFRHIMDLNKTDAKLLTKACTYKGHMYQGSPISPIIFNYYTIPLSKQIQGLKLNFISYADDIIIYSYEHIFSWKMVRVINRIVNENGLTQNKKKSKLCSYSRDKFYLGLKLGKHQIRQGQKHKKVLRHRSHKMWGTNEKDLKQQLKCVIQGHLNWIKAPTAFLFLHNCST